MMLVYFTQLFRKFQKKTFLFYGRISDHVLDECERPPRYQLQRLVAIPLKTSLVGQSENPGVLVYASAPSSYIRVTAAGHCTVKVCWL